MLSGVTNKNYSSKNGPVKGPDFLEVKYKEMSSGSRLLHRIVFVKKSAALMSSF